MKTLDYAKVKPTRNYLYIAFLDGLIGALSIMLVMLMLIAIMFLLVGQ